MEGKIGRLRLVNNESYTQPAIRDRGPKKEQSTNKAVFYYKWKQAKNPPVVLQAFCLSFSSIISKICINSSR